jgi:hypothetical protein
MRVRLEWPRWPKLTQRHSAMDAQAIDLRHGTISRLGLDGAALQELVRSSLRSCQSAEVYFGLARPARAAQLRHPVALSLKP